MKRLFFSCLFSLVVLTTFGQRGERLFSFTTTLGTGISMSTPSRTSFLWQVLGHYQLNTRFSVGVGTGLSFYEKALLPLYGDVKFKITRPIKFTPHVACGVGYSFGLDQNVTGGFYFSPSIGTEFSVCKKTKFLFAVGYELQKFERLKRSRDDYFVTEFQEHLSHHAIVFRVGVVFF